MGSSPITCSSVTHWASMPRGMQFPQAKKMAGTVRPLERGAQETKRELLRLAARELDWPEAGLTFAGDEIRRTDQEAGIRWSDLLARTGTVVTGRAHIEERGRSHITSFAVQVAEVSVDPETGEVKLLRFTTAHDVGQIVNPIGHQGQIDGAIMQGIGYALT